MSKNRFKFNRDENFQRLQGKLLVASPVLDNSPFRKTVVLLLQHNNHGSFGVVLNRPADENILRAWEDLSGSETGNKRDSNIVQGGPVGGPVFAIHEHASIGEMEMPGGIFVSAQSENLKQLVQGHNDRYKIVFGVAAWGEGQLQAEINEGCWFPVSATADHVFGSSEWMWEQQLRRYGRELTRDVFGLKDLPGDPQLN